MVNNSGLHKNKFDFLNKINLDFQEIKINAFKIQEKVEITSKTILFMDLAS